MPHLPSRALLRFAAYLLPFWTVGLTLWLGRTFGEVTVDQALWHLQYAENAAIQLSEVFVAEFVVEGLLVPAVLAAFAALLHGWAARRLSGWRRAALHSTPAVAVAAAAVIVVAQFSVVSHAAGYLQPDLFAEEFVDPHKVGLVQESRRNLVLIYAESLEASYGDPGLFGDDLLAATRRLGGHSYPRYRPVPGATWTIAAMVATQVCRATQGVLGEGSAAQRPWQDLSARRHLPR